MNESAEAEANEVCIVDDDPSVLESMHFLLASEGFKVRPFNKAEDFLAHASKHHVPVVVTDNLDGPRHRFGIACATLRHLSGHESDRHHCA